MQAGYGGNGIAKLSKFIEDTNRSIRAIPESVFEAAQPRHPDHKKANGKLTESGKACIFQLFEVKATPYAGAHLMKISLRSANLWFKFKRWQSSKP